MSLKALKVVTELRDTLPVRVGERWPEIADEVNGLLDQLAAAGDAVERQVIIDRLIALLDPFPLAKACVQDAFSTGGETRRRVRGGPYRRTASHEAASSKTLQRTPHLDLDAAGAIRPGTTFTARVYANTQGFAAGETGVAFELPDREELALQVWIVTSNHFEVLGEDSGVITIRRDAEESSSVVFTLRATRATAESDGGGITALFAFDGRPAGSVHRMIRVASESRMTVSEPPEAASAPPPALQVDPEAQTPDLTVSIERVPGGGDQRFSCTVSTPLLNEYADGVTEPWDLPGTTDKIVRNYMAGFTNPLAQEGARRAALVGAGRQLFRASPPVFQRAYYVLVLQGRRVAAARDASRRARRHQLDPPAAPTARSWNPRRLAISASRTLGTTRNGPSKARQSAFRWFAWIWQDIRPPRLDGIAVEEIYRT